MKVFVNSLPKSGTNLLAKLVRMVDVKDSGKSIASSSIVGNYQFAKSCLRLDHFLGNNVPVGLEFPVSVGYAWLDGYLKIDSSQYLSGHAAFSEQLAYLLRKNQLKQIQVFRHPAAVLVSWAKFTVEKKNRWHPSHAHLAKMSLDERCRFMLSGGLLDGGKYYQSSFIEILRRTDGWLDSEALVVRYEDIVGAKGGGSDEAQRLAIVNVMRHLGKDFDEKSLDRLQDQLYGGTHTFRSGQINGWKNDITTETVQLIEHALDSCKYSKELGYCSAGVVR
jgi:hypothetical protein